MKTNPYQCKAPVLVCGFNRPDLLATCLGNVKSVNPSRVYVSIDGPRAKVASDEYRVNACRQIAQSIDWCDEIHLKIEPVNLGCRRAMEGALNWFFNAEPEGIILEDDIEASPQFFHFCEVMLAQYRYDESVGCINGWTPVPNHLAPSEISYVTKYAHIWGWATWRRTWHSMQREPSSLTGTTLRSGTLLSRSHGKGIDQFWRDRIQLVRDDKLDSWAIPFSLGLTKAGVLSVSPRRSLVRNSGFGSRSTHTSRQKDASDEYPVDHRHPDSIYFAAHLEVDTSVDLDWAHDKYHFGFGEGANYWPRIKSKIYYYLHVIPYGKQLIPLINKFR